MPSMRDPDRNRYLNAVAHIEQEEIPFVELEVDFSVVQGVLGREVPPLSSFELPSSTYVEFLKRVGMDMAYIQVPWRLARRCVVDPEGRKVYQEGLLKNDTEPASIRLPALDAVEKRIEEILEALEPTRIGTIYGLETPSLLVNKAINYEDYFLYLREQPEFILDLQKRVDEYVAEVAGLVPRYPIDVIRLDSILCMNIGPMISLEMMEKFNFPWLEKYSRLIRDNGRIVCLHTDGNITSLIERFVQMGIDVLHPVEVCPGQDIYALKDHYGNRIALHGNIDVGGVLAHGTEDKIRSDVEEHIRRLGRGGGYICGSSHNIHEQIPTANFLAMVDAIHETRFEISDKPQPGECS